jgi:hypothetical protein
MECRKSICELVIEPKSIYVSWYIPSSSKSDNDWSSGKQIEPIDCLINQLIVFLFVFQREGRTKAIGNIVQVVQGSAPLFKFGTRKMLAPDPKQSELVTKEPTDQGDIPIQNLTINDHPQ